ncbi:MULTISPECIES: ABC transporter permease [Caldilinea]|jgi:peptide/nickel transport system permease protein|uniref:Putative oligopeptide ABC transporter permease protein n=1 Tax=Caldilinea aerophila (strain DSM 14535 / JCM 11387 / NBRC 104270 / STL-6-O1) TaxID=926550 RepID=I0I348_CALAS|nr:MULTISPECIES: ABC transporter permease [Caldilinea]MBO9391708.1 ABC transporter permease [Caldilinea sp.]BAL99685.1 putative oligopeptide ABC transporter permease protein [Caldilinea aerophila DSM 14535 = NBRC 104270]GIV73716.1 MAG: permease [Caldilinea sp.]
MARYVLGRLVGVLVVFLIVSVVIFLLMHAIPGGPYNEDKVPLSAEAKANYLRKYGLDRPLWEQYLLYMGNALRGDFGVPFQSPTETVAGLIARTWPVSASIGALALLVALPLGLLLGTLAAARQNTWVDYLTSATATLGITVPNFVVAVWLVLLFAVQFKWLPTGGWGQWQHYVMPVAALALAPMALTARYTRTSILEVSRSDYVRTARAKGLSERQIMVRHVLRNAMIPLLTILAPQIPNLITGTIFIESIFRVPGLGKFFVTSILARDYPMIMALMLLVAVVWSLVYLVTDILYTVVDPRVRLEKSRT